MKTLWDVYDFFHFTAKAAFMNIIGTSQNSVRSPKPIRSTRNDIKHRRKGMKGKRTEQRTLRKYSAR